MEITVTFENNEGLPVAEVTLGSAKATASSPVRRCHVLLDLPAGLQEPWETALDALGEAELRGCRDREELAKLARATDHLLILSLSPSCGPEDTAMPCPSERLMLPPTSTAADAPVLALWVQCLAHHALERQAMRRLVDRFEARIGRQANDARMTDLLKEANQHLQEQFVRDALTGVPNRRRFDEQIDYLWGRAVGEESSVAVLMLDIDFFKKLNDSLGHQVGDECLQRVAQRLFEIVDGEDDLLARYGGEEFVALLWDADETRACEVAERLRAGVEALQLANPGNAGGLVTISIGIAVERPTFTSSAEVFLHRADQALYLSKESGRNRWTLEGVV